MLWPTPTPRRDRSPTCWPQSRKPFAKVVRETDRTAAIAVADHDYLDNLLNTLPDKYRALGRQGMYGDFFSFYLCDIVLKLNGKGGQPVYVKVAGQALGAVRTEMKSFAERNPLVIGAVGVAAVAAIVVGGAAIPEAAASQPGQELLRLLRRRRGAVSPEPMSRCPDYPAGRVSGIELDGAQVLVRFTVDKNVRMGEATRGGDQDQEPAGHQVARCRAARRRASSTGPIPVERDRRRRTNCPTHWAISRPRSADWTPTSSRHSLSTLSETFADTPADLQQRGRRAWRGSPRPSTSATPNCATCWTTPPKPPACWPSAAIRSSAWSPTPTRCWRSCGHKARRVQPDLDEHLCGRRSS